MYVYSGNQGNASKRHLLAESASHSARPFCCCSFEIIQSNLDFFLNAHVACMQHLCLDHDQNAVVSSHFKWKEHRQSLILFIWRNLLYSCYLFDLGLVLKFQFSFVIYIYIIFKFCYLADIFIQSDLQMRRIEAIKINKRAIICNKVLY